MILYHVSDRIDRVSEKEFTPRVPNSVGCCGEDKTIPRICFSTSIEKCITAIGLDTDMQEYITVYTLDTSDIDESAQILKPNILASSKLVYDAVETDEHWILCPVKLKPKYYRILEAVWDIPNGCKSKSIVYLSIESVDYRTINNPFSGAISAMMGLQ